MNLHLIHGLYLSDLCGLNEHPEIDINIIIPNEENIKKVLERIKKGEI